MLSSNPNAGIQKKILHGGKSTLPDFVDGTKAVFHFRTSLADDPSVVFDDTRQFKKPLELIIGKKFKFEVFEVCVKTMTIGEVASFSVVKELVQDYPMVAMQLRKWLRGEALSRQCCGMLQATAGLGHPDLDRLLADPQSLCITLELLSVTQPADYKQERWLMTEDDRRTAVPELRKEGNELFRLSKWPEAAEKYADALDHLDSLLLTEKPRCDEWNVMDQQKVPLLLNLAQAELNMANCYQALIHADEALARDPSNVKGLFRRAKANAAVWNFKAARDDFVATARLDSKLSKAVEKELIELERNEAAKNAEEKLMFEGKLSS